MYPPEFPAWCKRLRLGDVSMVETCCRFLPYSTPSSHSIGWGMMSGFFSSLSHSPALESCLETGLPPASYLRWRGSLERCQNTTRDCLGLSISFHVFSIFVTSSFFASHLLYRWALARIPILCVPCSWQTSSRSCGVSSCHRRENTAIVRPGSPPGLRWAELTPLQLKCWSWAWSGIQNVGFLRAKFCGLLRNRMGIQYTVTREKRVRRKRKESWNGREVRRKHWKWDKKNY